MNLKLTKIYFSVQDYLMILFGTLLYGYRDQSIGGKEDQRTDTTYPTCHDFVGKDKGVESESV